MDGLRPYRLLKCGTTNTTKTGTKAAPRQQDNQKQQQRQKSITGWPSARKQNKGRHLPPMDDRPSEVKHGLSVPTGKPADMAASGHPFGALRPGQITPGRLRHPPAQPGACARHAGTVSGNRRP
jgi:hypothetical protein